MKKGFTLIELLIVIGILAILATVVTIILNPAELLAQARDSQRMSDLGSVKSAIALYFATNSSPTIAAAGPISTVQTTCCFGTCTVSTSTAVDGTGWVKINIAGATGGSPLAALPLDPSQSTTKQYAYKGNTSALTFELDAVLESNKYSPLMTKDGGNSPTCYEIGNAPGLAL